MTADLTKKFCFRPWEFMEIQDDTTMYPCCPNWVNNVNYGRVDRDLNFDDTWNGEKAKRFRASILDGSFRYCNKTQCPMIQNGSLPNVQDILDGNCGEQRRDILINKNLSSSGPEFINLCYDRSCNLRCPSCRQNFYFLSEKSNVDEYILKWQFQEKLIEFLYNIQTKAIINITGSGDPFASKLFWDLLTSLDGRKNPNIQIQLQTNGVLFTRENWNRLEKLHNNSISTIISLDAGTKKVYDRIRKGGDWNKLMRNLGFVDELHKQKKLSWVRLDFVCQNRNFTEMRVFVDIAKQHGFNCYFSRIVNWGTYSSIEFNEHNIFDPSHANHKQFLELINEDFGYDKVDFGNLTEFRTI